MSTKINFTADHLKKLQELSVKFLFDGTGIKGLVGTTTYIYDLIHNTTVNSLVKINVNLRQEVARIESLDEWSMNDYQQRKLVETKEMQELVNLLIGYKKNQEQIDANKAKVTDLKAKYKELKASTMKPEDQMKALEAEIAALGDTVEESTVPQAAPAQ